MWTGWNLAYTLQVDVTTMENNPEFEQGLPL